jgi:hypothetical protein
MAAPGVFAGLFGAWLGVAAAGCLLVGLAVTAAEARQEGRQSSHDHHHHEIGKRGPSSGRSRFRTVSTLR